VVHSIDLGGRRAFGNAQTSGVKRRNLVAESPLDDPAQGKPFLMNTHPEPLAEDTTAMAMTNIFRAIVSAVGGLLSAVAIGPFAYAESRGELLYSTHCIACHTTQMHWRDKKVATDWTSLKFQVRRWQDASSLSWSESDIQEVTRYLNESIYRYPPLSDPLTRLAPPIREHDFHTGSRR